ncbi:MAG: hypothetical protein ISS23_02325 [Nanoarchaeota archaeon]|nr:hypothetical protein [Nanoarchaeota archaeon]
MSLEDNVYKLEDFSDFKITKSALTKAFAYAQIVNKLFDERLEITFWLTSEYKPLFSGVVSDIYCPKQLVTTHNCIETREVYEEIVNEGNVMVGWCHSHGFHDTFHSRDDEEKFKHKYIGLLSGGGTQTKIQKNENSVEDVSFAYSLVINDHFSKPYKEIVMENHTTGELIHRKDKNEDIPLTVIDDKKELDYKGIVSDIKENVTRVDNINFKNGSPGARLSNRTLSDQELEEIVNKVELEVQKYIKEEPQKEEPSKVEPVTPEEVVQSEVVEELDRTEEQDGILEEKVQEPQTETVEQSAQQEREYGEETCRTQTYMGRLEGLYNNLRESNDPVDKLIGALSRVYSGKECWRWDKRYEKGSEILKKIKKKILSPEQEANLDNIRSILESNKYVKKKHSLIFRDIQRRLESKKGNFYCITAFWKDRLFYKPFKYKRSPKHSDALEEVVQKVNNGHVVDVKDLEQAVKTYNKGRAKKAFKKVARYASLAALAAALVLIPVKYVPKDVNPVKKPVAVYTVKKGDNLWNLTKDYLKKNKVKVDNKLVYKVVDQVAEENGKGKQAEYKIGGKEKKNPHHIKPKQKIKFSKKVLKHAKKKEAKK